MLSVYLIGCAIFYCIIGCIIIIWPGKTKHKLNRASNSTIRLCGVIVFCAGIWLAIAVGLFNWALVLLDSLRQ